MKNIKIITSLIIALVLIIYYLGGLDRVNYALLNYFFYLRRPIELSKDMVVIGITDQCLRRFGRWPWKREHYVKLLKILKESGVRAVGIDIIFSEPAGSIDKKLASITQELGKVVYPAYLNPEDSNLYTPIPILAKMAFGIGHINIIPAVNGFIYSIPLSLHYNDIQIQAFSFKLASVYLDREIKDIPVDNNGSFLINYTGEKINIIPFSDVLEGKIPINKFRDKIVLVGLTARGVGDYYLAPSYSELFSGLEIHANAVNTIVTGRFLTRLPREVNILVTIIILLPFFFLIINFNPIKALLIGLTLIFISIFTSFLIFLLKGVIFDTPPLVLSVLASIGFFEVSAYVKEKEEKERIKNIFQMYLSPEVIDTLLKHPEFWNLQGEEVEATIMFVDISGFTRFSQEHRPQEVVVFLNRYFSMVSDIVFKHRGTLDKFIGDAIMAIYGAPIRYKDHQIEAIESAYEIIEMAKKENFSVKIGINTGNVILGNIGTERRIQYTAIGDPVNMAEYLESIANPGEILIGEQTYNAVREKIKAKEMILTGKYDGHRAYIVY